MKNKKLLIIVITVIVIIAVGAILTAVMLQPKQIEERDYKTVVEVKDNETSVDDAKDLKYTAEEIGFEKPECTDTTICIAKHNTYQEEGKEDFVSIMNDESGVIISIGLHFLKKDFTVDNIYKQLNAVAGNFIGMEITKSQIEKIKNNLPTSGDNQMSIETFTMGNNTIEINMLKVDKTDYYLVKLGVFPTTFYNNAMGAK